MGNLFIKGATQMGNLFIKGTICLSVFAASITSFAEVLTLEKMREEVLRSNLDVKMQYEKYYQAQRNVSVKYGEFSPNLNFHVLYAPTTASLLQSVVPTPSDWFAYQASKELAIAEEYVSQTLKLNILEGLTNNFINIKFQQKILELLEQQRQILAAEYETAQANEAFGMGSRTRTFEAKRGLLQHEQQIFLIKSLIAVEKETLLIALNKTPASKLVLAELPADDYVFPLTAHEAAVKAQENSTEIVSNEFMQEAAKYMIRSAKYSFLSFNGIGFDYPALVSIEHSKAEGLRLQGLQIRLKIVNQIDRAYQELDHIDQRIELQEQNLEIANMILMDKNELFAGGVISVEEVNSAKKDVLEDKRKLVSLELERRVKKNNIKRILSLDATLMSNDGDIDADNLVELKIQNFRRKNVTVSVLGAGELGNKVVSVKYKVEGFRGESRSVNGSANYSIQYKFRRGGSYNVTATVLLANGKKVIKTGVIKL